MEALAEALFRLSGRLAMSGFLENDENHAAYNKVVRAWVELRDRDVSTDPREGSVKFVRDCDNPNAPPVCYEFRDGAWRNRDGWINWAGGECPVLDCVRVDVKLRDGRLERNCHPGTWNWHHVPHPMRSDPIGDIIAYRLSDA